MDETALPARHRLQADGRPLMLRLARDGLREPAQRLLTAGAVTAAVKADAPRRHVFVADEIRDVLKRLKRLPVAADDDAGVLADEVYHAVVRELRDEVKIHFVKYLVYEMARLYIGDRREGAYLYFIGRAQQAKELLVFGEYSGVYVFGLDTPHLGALGFGLFERRTVHHSAVYFRHRY